MCNSQEVEVLLNMNGTPAEWLGNDRAPMGVGIVARFRAKSLGEISLLEVQSSVTLKLASLRCLSYRPFKPDDI